MKKLENLSDLTQVTNPEHKKILTLLRDTNLSVPAIAKQSKISTRKIYYVVERYMVKGFLTSRYEKQNSLRLEPTNTNIDAEDDDLVIVIPRSEGHEESAIDNSSSKNTDETALQPSKPSANLPTGVGLQEKPLGKQNLPESETDAANLNHECALTIESRSFKLQWIGAAPEHATEICMVLNALQSKSLES